MSDSLVSAHLGADNYLVTVQAGHHRLFADEPESVGGGDRAARPAELLAAALGSCMAITVRMYADRKQWPLAGVDVRVQYAAATREVRARFACQLRFDGNLDEAQRARLLEIAGRCPVHRVLASGADVTAAMDG